MTLVTLITPRARARCRDLYELHRAISRAVADGRHADIARLRVRYEACRDDCKALGVSELEAFRVGAG